MTTRLTRTRSVLHRLSGNKHDVTYGRDPEEVVDGASFRKVVLTRADADDLGLPDKITVTIHPGDLLNAELEPGEDNPEPTYGDATFEPVERADGRWDWRLVHANGDVLCGSDQGYENRADAFEIGRRCLSGGYMVTAGWD